MLWQDAQLPPTTVTLWEKVPENVLKLLLAWQEEDKFAPISQLDPSIPISKIALLPEREWLYARCDLRFRLMIEQGVMDEVAQVAGLDPSLPAMRALGVSHLLAHQRGDSTLEEAIVLSQTATRQYAKRQMTWLRNQFSDWNLILEKESERIIASAYNIVIEN